MKKLAYRVTREIEAGFGISPGKALLVAGGSRLVLAGSSRVDLWDVENRKRLTTLWKARTPDDYSHVHTCRMLGKTRFALQPSVGGPRFFDVVSGLADTRLATSLPQRGYIRQTDLSHDGTVLASLDDSRLRIFDASSLEQLYADKEQKFDLISFAARSNKIACCSKERKGSDRFKVRVFVLDCVQPTKVRQIARLSANPLSDDPSTWWVNGLSWSADESRLILTGSHGEVWRKTKPIPWCRRVCRGKWGVPLDAHHLQNAPGWLVLGEMFPFAEDQEAKVLNLNRVWPGSWVLPGIGMPADLDLQLKRFAGRSISTGRIVLGELS